MHFRYLKPSAKVKCGYQSHEKNFLFIIFFACSLSLCAQRFNGGIGVGTTFSQIDGDNLSGYNKVGVCGGFFVNTTLKKNIIGQFEIKYTEKGARSKMSLANPFLFAITLKYIEFPFLFKYTVKKQYILQPGLYIATLFQKNARDEYGPIRQDLLLPYHRFDAGGILSAAYKLSESFFLDFRYSYTFIRIYKIPGGSPAGPWYFRGHYNNVVSFSLYYQFK